MKYSPSGNFLLSVNLLAFSFVIMQVLVIPGIVKDDLAAQARSAKISIPKELPITGELGLEIFEEFGEDRNITTVATNYFIKKDDGTIYKIKSGDEDQEEILSEFTGQKISYNPTKKEIKSVMSKNIDSRGLTPRPGTKGNRDGKAAVFLIKFDAPQNEIDADATASLPNYREVEDYLFDEDEGMFQKFYNEMTHGRVVYDGDVFGWYDLPGAGTDPEYQGVLGQCTFRDMTAGAQQALFEPRLQTVIDHYGIDMSIYNTIIIMTSCDSYNNLGGYASFPTIQFDGEDYYFAEIKGYPSRFHFNGTATYDHTPDYIWTVQHEIGHTFGLGHSRALDCNDETMSGVCVDVDQGNPFDAMGLWGKIINFLQQESAGWIKTNNILKINQTGSYHLDSLMTPNGVVGAKITLHGMIYPVFALEHRKAESFDTFLGDPMYDSVTNGLILYAKTRQGINWTLSNNAASSWQLVDPHPTQDSIIEDVKYDAITAALPYEDENFGLSINVTNVDSQGIDFDVYIDQQSPFFLSCVPYLNNPLPANDIFRLTVTHLGQEYEIDTLPDFHVGDQLSINVIANYDIDAICPYRSIRLGRSATSTAPSSWGAIPPTTIWKVRPQQPQTSSYSLLIDNTFTPPVSKTLKVFLEPLYTSGGITYIDVPINLVP